jgi:hypothetical protein
MNQIPLISEIKEEDIIDNHWYKVYPTILHKENNSPWFFPGRDLKLEIQFNNKHVNYLMWGK